MSFKPSSTALALALSLAYAGLACAQDATPAVTDSTTLDRVTVTMGRGQLRSVQSLSKAEFETAVAGTSPLETVSRLPGVNFQSADALGNYEWSTRFTVRAFSQNQLGFTLDDVPLGDMSYGNLNGLHISRAISSENVGRAFLSQGSGALDTASSSNLGGTVQFYSDDPSQKFGLRLSETLGSDSNRRTYLRLDSGDTGFGKLYLSYTNQDADKWKAHGEQRLEQWNFKYALDFAGDNHFTAFMNTSKRREVDYQDMSLQMINTLGYGFDNFYPDMGAAVKAANTLCGNNGSTYVAACDYAYYAGAGLRDDQLYGASLDLKLTKDLDWKSTAYYHHNRGEGLWFTPEDGPSKDGTPILERTTEYGINRKGLVTGLSWELGDHLIKLGYWHEDNDFNQARRYYNVAASNPPSVYDWAPYTALNRTKWQYDFVTKTDQFSLADTWAVAKDLSLGYGFKSLRASTDATLLNSDLPPAKQNFVQSGSITASNGFLPQAGLNYQLSRSDELFASAARNMRAYQAAAAGAVSPFVTTQAGLDAIRGSLKPETSDNYEAGWRSQTSQYQASVTGYLVNFHDRLLAVTQGTAIAGNPSVLANVGGVRTVGLEAAISLRLTPSVSWYNSLSQSKSTYQDDAFSKNADGSLTQVAFKDAHVVDAPDTMIKSVLSYDNGQLFGNLGLDYMSKRYYTYSNDNSVPSRTLFNLSSGYRVKRLGFLSEASIQAGVTNLTDQKYIATIGSTGWQTTDPNGTQQTLLPGAPRQFFVTFSGKL